MTVLQLCVVKTTIVSIIEMKLPEDIRRKWAEAERVSMDDSPVDKANKFPHLLKYLPEVGRTIRYLSAELRGPIPIKERTNQQCNIQPRGSKTQGIRTGMLAAQ